MHFFEFRQSSLQGLQYENLEGNWCSCWLTSLCELQICGKTVGDLIAVDDMHQRKAEMARRADAFIALPGTRIFLPMT